MNAATFQRESPEFPEACNIVVLYENDQTRTRAMAACDYLVQQFWQQVELKFHWWRADFLRDSRLAALAADSAVQADFLVISSERAGEFSGEVEAWFETWLERRTEPVGALIDLPPATARGAHDPARDRFLSEVSRRGRFEYLTALPGSEGTTPPDSKSSALAGIGADILGESRPPSHHGLNE